MASISKKKLALIEKYNQEKLRNQAMKIGVTLKSPETVFLSNDTKFGKNVIINPYVVIGKKTKIGNNVEILSFTHIENAILESNVNVGPFSRIRPGSFSSSIAICHFCLSPPFSISTRFLPSWFWLVLLLLWR